MGLKLKLWKRGDLIEAGNIGWYLPKLEAEKYAMPLLNRAKVENWDKAKWLSASGIATFSFRADEECWGLIWEEEENEFGPISP